MITRHNVEHARGRGGPDAEEADDQVDEEVYRNPHEQVGGGRTSGLIEALVRPYQLLAADQEEGYRAMAADTEGERDTVEWAEGLLDVAPG